MESIIAQSIPSDLTHPMVEILWNYYPFNYLFPYWIKVPATLVFWPFCLLFAWHTIIWNFVPNAIYYIFFFFQYVFQIALSIAIVVLLGPIVVVASIFFWPFVLPFWILFLPYLFLKMNGDWFI